MIEENVLKENRNYANLEVDKQRRYKEILECLGNNEMTAKEISNEMYMRGYTPTNERNFTSPRLTELLINGIVEVIGKKKCEWTGKSVSVYRRRTNE